MRYRTAFNRLYKAHTRTAFGRLCGVGRHFGRLVIGVYQPLVDWAGAGATVPLTGFGNLLAQGTKEAIREQGLLGVLTGPLTAGSAGIMAAIFSGLAVSFLAKPKSK